MAETVIPEVVVPVAKWTIKWTLTKLWQELGYMCCYESNIGDLNDQVQQLRHKRDGIKVEAKSATDASKSIDGQVIDWLVKAEKQIEENDKSFSEGSVAAKAACCNGWLPNLKGRFSLGRKAKKMTLAVDELLTKDLGIIAHPASHPSVEFQSTEVSTDQEGTNIHEGASSSGTSNHKLPPASGRKNVYFDSRRSTIEKVMEGLRRNQINPIIICGLGGIGKTTLMGQVHDRAKKEGLFDEYTMATFKESLNVFQIQGELAEYLGKKHLEDENQIGPRASKLRERLSQGSKKILVMLDNVLTTTPDLLWDIGIPLSCQLLVTSRQQDLFKDMATRKNFLVDGLPDTDAWSLFEKTAGSCIKTDRELHVVAEKILKKCGGLPIAISTGEEAKSCFLLCCIFEGSADIRIEDLLRYGLGLGLFKGTDSMVTGRNRVETLVQKLKSRFLLLDTDDPECVRVHDVVGDVALYIASEEFANRIVVRDTTTTAKLMDWPKDNDFEESAYCSSLGVSGLCQLLLLRMDDSVEPPPTIFNRMEDLKVLAITGRNIWGQVSLESLVPSLAVLRNLQTLRLEYCNFSCDMSVIGKLETLMILSLRGSNIKRLPETFKDLSDLRLLDLTECEQLREIAPGVISSLYQLEELYMWNSFQDWVVEKLASTETTNWISQLEQESDSEEETKVETWKRLNRLAVEQPTMVREAFQEECEYGEIGDQLTSWANSMDWETGLFRELLSLSRLTTLQVILQPVNILVTTTLFSKLERFRISIGWEERIDDYYLEEQSGNYLRVYDLDVGVAMGSWITKLLEKASHVELKLTQPQLVNVLDRVRYEKTKRLKLQNCKDVEHLFNLATHPRSSCAIFPVLHTLEISYAKRLKEIFHCELPTGSLKELQTLSLSNLRASLPSQIHIETFKFSLSNLRASLSNLRVSHSFLSVFPLPQQLAVFSLFPLGNHLGFPPSPPSYNPLRSYQPPPMLIRSPVIHHQQHKLSVTNI